MGEKALVESLVEDAVRLIRKLDYDGNAPSLAAWYYYDDVDEWRLLMASPAFDKLLPKRELVAYQQLVEAITELGLSSLSVSDIKLLPTDSQLAEAIRSLIRTSPAGIVQAHFTNNTLNGIFINETSIMRST